MSGRDLGVVIASGEFTRAHAAFIAICAAAALGRKVTVFAMGGGCHALLEDWHGLDGAGQDAALAARGVPDFATLRAAANELGVALVVCETALRGAALDEAALYEDAEIGGFAGFLHDVDDAQLLSF